MLLSPPSLLPPSLYSSLPATEEEMDAQQEGSCLRKAEFRLKGGPVGILISDFSAFEIRERNVCAKVPACDILLLGPQQTVTSTQEAQQPYQTGNRGLWE